MYKTVLYEVSEHVATLTLNQPEIRNPLGAESVPEVIAALEEFRLDDDARALIITGAGKCFCAGGNVKQMKREPGWQAKDDSDGNGSKGYDPIAQREHYRRGIQRIPLTLAKIDKPVIAAVNGAAIGAGCDLTLMADIRIASEHAKFAESFCKVGLAPGDGGAWFLPRIVGIEKACEMMFTGDMVDAEEALRIGLVGRVVPADQLMPTANELAARFAQGATLALKMAKCALYRGLHQTLDESLEFIALMQGMLQGTEDHQEAVSAFIDKRTPVFKGR